MTTEIVTNKEKVSTKKYPHYSGKIQDGLRNEIGKISLWDNLEPSSEKSPLLEGSIEVDGVKYKVALWKFVPKPTV